MTKSNSWENCILSIAIDNVKTMIRLNFRWRALVKNVFAMTKKNLKSSAKPRIYKAKSFSHGLDRDPKSRWLPWKLFIASSFHHDAEYGSNKQYTFYATYIQRGLRKTILRDRFEDKRNGTHIRSEIDSKMNAMEHIFDPRSIRT